MVGKKIIYVHGFMSAGSTHTAQILRDYMPQATVIAPDLPIHPEEAMELLRNLVKTENPDLIIGTSMGGMYTEMLYGVDRICVNPAFQMGSTITESNMMGKQVYQNERQDGEKEVIVTKALVKEYKEMTEQCFAQVTEEEQLKVFGLFGDEDRLCTHSTSLASIIPKPSTSTGSTDSLKRLSSTISCPSFDGLTIDKKGANGVLFLSVRIPLPMDMVSQSRAYTRLMNSYSITITSIS